MMTDASYPMKLVCAQPTRDLASLELCRHQTFRVCTYTAQDAISKLDYSIIESYLKYRV
jgi:hypothetical protein